MKNTGEVIFLLFVIIILLFIIGYLISCKTITNSTFNEIATENASNETPVVEGTKRELTQNELDLFEQYLESRGVWNFLYVEYADVSEFNLKEFLTYYFEGSIEATDKEVLEITGEKEAVVPLHLYWKTVLDDTFKTFTGKDVSVITNKELLPDMTKDEKYYYTRTSDANFADFELKSGTEDGSTYVIRYSVNCWDEDKNGEYDLTLNKVDGKFQFVSNVKAK